MPRVRIVCISDTHGQHIKLSVPDGDVLVHAGDFMAFGYAPKEIADFNHWLSTQPHRYKVVIAGNHDVMIDGHAGQKHLDGEGVAEHVAVATLWGAVRLAEVGNLE